MKIEIDQDGCIGSGNCESVCSEVFKVEDGRAKIISSALNGDRLEEVIQAAQDCPVQVISVWEDSKRIYPLKK